MIVSLYLRASRINAHGKIGKDVVVAGATRLKSILNGKVRRVRYLIFAPSRRYVIEFVDRRQNRHRAKNLRAGPEVGETASNTWCTAHLGSWLTYNIVICDSFDISDRQNSQLQYSTVYLRHCRRFPYFGIEWDLGARRGSASQGR
jgi:hypothetical protein